MFWMFFPHTFHSGSAMPAPEARIEVLDPSGLAADPSNLTLIIHHEDHTLGNSLKHILCQMEDVEFAGYNIPHPLEDKMLIRLQTTPGVKASEVLVKALNHLQAIFADIRQKAVEACSE